MKRRSFAFISAACGGAIVALLALGGCHGHTHIRSASFGYSHHEPIGYCPPPATYHHVDHVYIHGGHHGGHHHGHHGHHHGHHRGRHHY